MKTFIETLDRARLMLIISILCFFNGVALLAPGIAFFDGDTGRIVPLAFSVAAFYCVLRFSISGIKLLKQKAG